MADNIAIFRINYKSDFILTLNSDAGWETPFCIKFWTRAPSQAYFAGYDGTTYTHCAPVDGEPTKLRVQFDDHHLPIGDLKFQIGYHFTVEDFPTSVEDEVLNQASVIIEVDDTPAHVMLDFNGETAPEIEFSLPAYANEAQRIANEQQRIENEQARISAENERISNEDARIAEEQVRVSQEAARMSEFAQLKEESQQATGNANAAAALANEKAQLAADKAALADDAATLANDKAALAQQKAAYAQEQGDYAKAQGDIAQADHQRAESDHTTATADHTQADADHNRAESDHTRAESDHEAVEVYVDSLGAFDISAYHATGGVLAKYADLTAALGTGGANIPDTLRKGGMSVKFVQSSDNKYVQYFLTKDEWSVSEEYWQKVNLEEEVDRISVIGIDTQISANRLDLTTCVLGYIDKNTGALVNTSNRYASDFIPVSDHGLYCYGSDNYGSIGGSAVYDANKEYLRVGTSNRYTYQEGDAYVRFTLGKNYVEGGSAYVVVADGVYSFSPYKKNETIAKENIPEPADNSIGAEKLSFQNTIMSANLGDTAACYKNAIVDKTTGAVMFDTTYTRYATDFIPVSQEGLYCNGYSDYGNTGRAAVYDADKKFIRAFYSAAYTYEDGDAFVRWTVSVASVETPTLMINAGTSAQTYTPYFAPKHIIKAENLPPVTQDKLAPGISFPATLPAISLCGKDCIKATAASIVASGALQITDFPQYLKASGIVSFNGKLSSFNDISVGFGTSTNSIQVKVDATNIYFIKSGSQVGAAVEHGLTISDFINVTFDNDFFHPKVIVSTLSGIFVHERGEFASLESYGYPVAVMGTGTSVTDAELRATSDKFNKPIWAVGDSYTSLYDERWTKQMVKTIGIDNFLTIGLAGGGSGDLYADLQKASAFGTPKFLIWCLGMNDSYAGWSATLEQVISYCDANGIELILQTIPIPNLETSNNQVQINNAIRESGYRFIDACSAMCYFNGTTWEWYSDFTDEATKVHPNVLGAKVLAARFLSDFPEFIQ